MSVIDLFAGPGGWDVAARALGIDPLGIELDDAACATRAAAGLRTIQADVATTVIAEDTELLGLIASPPCQTFSLAGNGAGRRALDDVLLAVDLVARGLPVCEFDDPRTALVVQPLRYALLHEPEWVAWEQVPPVLPVWRACADVLRAEGYSVWTGYLHAEQYGVPQTRKRAVLLGSRVRRVGMPTPTHSRYYVNDPGRLDLGVEQWVSMAEAIGRAMTERPSMTVTGGGSATGGAEPFGNGARRGMLRELEAGRWRFAGAGQTAELTAGQLPRELSAPAHTITGKGTAVFVDRDRPSPTIAADPRISPRGCKHPREGCCSQWNGTPGLQFGAGTIRVTVQEAGILQSFDADFPWRGTQTKQFQQVGNAIPPLLALHALAEVTGIPLAKTGVAA